MPTTVPAKCRPLQQEIAALKADRTALQEDIQGASTQQKAGLAAAIATLTRKINTKQLELNRCVKATA